LEGDDGGCLGDVGGEGEVEFELSVLVVAFSDEDDAIPNYM
jgi:hypothetical protein